MQLSPLTQENVIARQRAAEAKGAPTDVNKAERVALYRCPVCGDKCGTARNAADCCLWKDFDALTRWQMADAVEAGSDWTTELSLRTH